MTDGAEIFSAKKINGRLEFGTHFKSNRTQFIVLNVPPAKSKEVSRFSKVIEGYLKVSQGYQGSSNLCGNISKYFKFYLFLIHVVPSCLHLRLMHVCVSAIFYFILLTS